MDYTANRGWLLLHIQKRGAEHARTTAFRPPTNDKKARQATRAHLVLSPENGNGCFCFNHSSVLSGLPLWQYGGPQGARAMRGWGCSRAEFPSCTVENPSMSTAPLFPPPLIDKTEQNFTAPRKHHPTPTRHSRRACVRSKDERRHRVGRLLIDPCTRTTTTKQQHKHTSGPK